MVGVNEISHAPIQPMVRYCDVLRSGLGRPLQAYKESEIYAGIRVELFKK